MLVTRRDNKSTNFYHRKRLDRIENNFSTLQLSNQWYVINTSNRVQSNWLKVNNLISIAISTA